MTSSSRWSPVVLAALVLALAPSAALAAGTVAPPGNSAVGEYLETVPSADGPQDRPPSGGARLSPTTQSALRAQGSDGEAVLALSQPGGGSGTKHAVHHRSAQRTAGGAVAAAARRPGSVTSAVVRAVTKPTAGGMGLLFPLILGGTLLAGLGVGVTRARR